MVRIARGLSIQAVVLVLGAFLAATTLGQQVNTNNCNPGVCASIPGLVYNADLDQCAWPDEVGCSLSGLGYFGATCLGTSAYALKPVTFNLGPLPGGKTADQYFLVCVPETTPADRLLRSPFPTGPVAPRLLGCPGELVFNPGTMRCE